MGPRADGGQTVTRLLMRREFDVVKSRHPLTAPGRIKMSLVFTFLPLARLHC
jgi:hypothetical protein